VEEVVMGLLEAGKATQSPDFVLRVRMAVFGEAQQVLIEPEDTPGHTQRVALARQMVGAPSRQTEQLIWLVASDPKIAGTVRVDADPAKVKVDAGDADIQAAVRASWDAAAGWTGY
jgi:hypothetical protein